MIRLEKSDRDRVLPVLDQLAFRLAARSVALGHSQGQVYVDDPSAPGAAFVRTGHRWHLAGGDPDDPALVARLAQLFVKVWTSAKAAGGEALILYFAPDCWRDRLEDLFPGVHPILRRRAYLELEVGAHQPSFALPEGIELCEPTPEMVEAGTLVGVDELAEEMCSERASVEDFFAQSFGLIALEGNTLAGWCLSEYNVSDRCEVGIATLEPYRRRGVATAMASAFVALARRRGISRIGWHAWADNAGSLATARKLGFRPVLEHDVALCFFHAALHHAVQANLLFDANRYDEAAAAYRRALALEAPPPWTLWNAACAHALAGHPQKALELVSAALEAGVVDRERVLSSPHLVSLHHLSEWNQLVERLQ